MFSRSRAGRGPRLESRSGRAVFFGVYLAGLILWGAFFEWGAARFTAFDWPKEYAYFDVLRQGVADTRWPLHTRPEFQGTARFLANPEVPLSPQLVLFRWLTVRQYIVVNWLLLYTCGAIGTYLLGRRLRLGLLPTVFLFVVFAFNGHIVAHVAVGHSMWSGYFLFPLFALALLKLLNERPSTLLSRSGGLAVVLTLCMAQGAFHMTAWLLGFTALAGAARRGARIATATSLTIFGALTAYRWMPAIVAFSELRRPANVGYPTIDVLADALLTVRDWNTPPIENVGWWEYDIFLGHTGTALVILFSIAALVRRPQYRTLLLPIGALLVLSMGDTFRPIADLPLPLVNSERGPTRFLIVPVFFLAMLAAVGANQRLEGRVARVARMVAGCALVGVVAADLYGHFDVWRLASIETRFLHRGVQHATIVSTHDPEYLDALRAGWLVTASTTALLLVSAIRRWNRRY